MSWSRPSRATGARSGVAPINWSSTYTSAPTGELSTTKTVRAGGRLLQASQPSAPAATTTIAVTAGHLRGRSLTTVGGRGDRSRIALADSDRADGRGGSGLRGGLDTAGSEIGVAESDDSMIGCGAASLPLLAES